MRRLQGWEPSERHEHYDTDDNLTGYTVVIREADWSPTERDRMLALAIYEAGVCECGLHQSQLDDPDNHPHTIETRICKVCAAIEAYQRVQAETDQRAIDQLGKKPAAKAPRPDDGRRLFLKPVDPGSLQG